MITVTPAAAQQIRLAASQSDADEQGLRIAVRRDADGSLHYAMGWDEPRGDDLVLPADGVALVVSPGQRDLLEGMTLDYVEYEAGDFRFIFINPNDRAPLGSGDDRVGNEDPQPPGPAGRAEKGPAAGGCGGGACGCGSRGAA